MSASGCVRFQTLRRLREGLGHLLDAALGPLHDLAAELRHALGVVHHVLAEATNVLLQPPVGGPELAVDLAVPGNTGIGRVPLAEGQ